MCIHPIRTVSNHVQYNVCCIEEEKLDMNGANRVSTLFSGTSIVTVRGGQAGSEVEEASYKSGINLLARKLFILTLYLYDE